MENMNTVTIPLERYEELLDAETRLNTAVSYLVNDNFAKTETLLWILGTELACQKAQELHDEDEKRRKEREVHYVG